MMKKEIVPEQLNQVLQMPHIDSMVIQVFLIFIYKAVLLAEW